MSRCVLSNPIEAQFFVFKIYSQVDCKCTEVHLGFPFFLCKMKQSSRFTASVWTVSSHLCRDMHMHCTHTSTSLVHGTKKCSIANYAIKKPQTSTLNWNKDEEKTLSTNDWIHVHMLLFVSLLYTHFYFASRFFLLSLWIERAVLRVALCTLPSISNEPVCLCMFVLFGEMANEHEQRGKKYS